jgi:hypothetical protein
MANAPKRPVVLRYRFGKGLVKARKESENTARAIVSNVAVQYAEDTWNEAKDTLRARIEEDVRAELVNLSRMFREYIIGAPGSRTTPNGTLTTLAKGDERPQVSLSSMLPAWTVRSDQYMERKRAEGIGIGWFDNTGWVSSSGYPDSPGLLRETFAGSDGGMRRGSDVWEDIFGPVKVRIVRQNNATPESTLRTGKKNVRMQVARISVAALGKVDNSMLSAFRSSNPRLETVLDNYNPLLSVRLGVMRNGVYRPTLEPFLDFFLTRAIPHTVNERIRKGTLGSVFRN